jgi:hypothetical protein
MRSRPHVRLAAAWQRIRGSNVAGMSFDAWMRIDTPNERLLFRHGAIRRFVLRQLRSNRRGAPAR